MKKLRIGLINTSFYRIGPHTKKGTEIFDYMLINALQKYHRKTVNITSFCSGDSQIPVKKESIMYRPTVENHVIGEQNHYIFELALISKALSMHSKFDIYHFNSKIGDYILPFAQFVKKPIVITMHGNTNEPYQALYTSLFQKQKNVYFVPISDAQKKFLPGLNYSKTIYHGLNPKRFSFDPHGGDYMIWTGRAQPEKGLDTVILIAKKLKIHTRVFPIIKNEYLRWLHEEIIKKRDLIDQIVKVYIEFNVPRSSLVKEYQRAKLFIFPLRWEEPFGLTLIEALATGTPVVAYACGAIPEIIKDGVTGFIVNPSNKDIRGNWIIKKTGVEGLCEAIRKIYSLPKDQYYQMRKACRMHFEESFTDERMSLQYVELYKEILKKK